MAWFFLLCKRAQSETVYTGQGVFTRYTIKALWDFYFIFFILRFNYNK